MPLMGRFTTMEPSSGLPNALSPAPTKQTQALSRVPTLAAFMPTTIKLKPQTKRIMKSPRIRFDSEKLKDPKIADVFQARVGGKFASLYVLDSDVDTFCE